MWIIAYQFHFSNSDIGEMYMDDLKFWVDGFNYVNKDNK
jgi:hypothetical protein